MARFGEFAEKISREVRARQTTYSLSKYAAGGRLAERASSRFATHRPTALDLLSDKTSLRHNFSWHTARNESIVQACRYAPLYSTPLSVRSLSPNLSSRPLGSPVAGKQSFNHSSLRRLPTGGAPLGSWASRQRENNYCFAIPVRMGDTCGEEHSDYTLFPKPEVEIGKTLQHLFSEVERRLARSCPDKKEFSLSQRHVRSAVLSKQR